MPPETPEQAVEPPPAPADRAFLLAAAALVVLGGALRLYGLGAQDLWLDEAWSFWEANGPGFSWRTLLQENTPPLHALVLRAATALLGPGEAAARLPSAVAGTLFVAAVVWLGREAFAARAGLWAGLFAALSPIHVYYSQEARAYALLALALAVSHAALWRALATDRWAWWAAFSALAALSLQSHALALLGLLPTAWLALTWPDPPGDASRRRHYLLAALAAASLALPWAVGRMALGPAESAIHDVSWVRTAWERTPPALAILRTLETFALGSQAGLLPIYFRQFARMDFPAWLRFPGLAGAALLAIGAFGPWGDAGLGVPWLRRRKAWLAVLLAAPLLAMWLASLVRPLYVAGRYDLVAFPAYPLVMGLALAKAPGLPRLASRLALAAATLVLVAAGAKLALYHGTPAPPETGRTLAAALDAVAADGDVVVFSGPRGIECLYYLGRLGYAREDGTCVAPGGARRFACRLFPRERERDPTVAGRNLASPEAVREDLEAFLRPLRRPGGKVWLVVERASAGAEALVVSREDGPLLAELERLGFEGQALSVPLGLLRFRRP